MDRLYSVLLLIMLTFFILAFITNPSFVKFISAIGWFLPIADYCLGLVHENVTLIPDWFYQLRRDTHQNSENKIADSICNRPFGGKNV